MNNKYRTLLYSLTSLLFLAGCSSTTVSLKSTPQKADVYIQRLGDGTTQKIGKTPIQISAKELQKKLGGDLPLVVNFKLDGYREQRIIITELPSADIEISQTLKVSTGFEGVLQANLIVDNLFEAQKLARSQKFKESLSKLNDIKKSTPELAIIYELEGGIHYMQKAYQKSLDSYIRALSYNPKSSEAIRMTKVLTDRYGVKRVINKKVPSGTSPPESSKQ